MTRCEKHEPGCFSPCPNCGMFSAYAAGLLQRQPTPTDEADMLDADEPACPQCSLPTIAGKCVFPYCTSNNPK